MNHFNWRDKNHAIELYTENVTWQKINYIHRNPVVDKMVYREQDYLFSSARNYFDLPSVLDVICLTPPVIKQAFIDEAAVTAFVKDLKASEIIKVNNFANVTKSNAGPASINLTADSKKRVEELYNKTKKMKAELLNDQSEVPVTEKQYQDCLLEIQMKTITATVLGVAGLIYGLLAVNLAYQDSPENLRWFIVGGVTGVGASVGWLIGFALSLFRENLPAPKPVNAEQPKPAAGLVR